jgi:hypothetical protein
VISGDPRAEPSFIGPKPNNNAKTPTAFPPPPTNAMSSPSRQTLRTAYRHLLKAAYAAVQYTVPERFIVRDKLRRAFRFSPTSRYNPQRIHNTLEFLDLAATKRGLEHKLVKNLCLVHYHHVSFRKKRFAPFPGREREKEMVTRRAVDKRQRRTRSWR